MALYNPRVVGQAPIYPLCDKYERSSSQRRFRYHIDGGSLLALRCDLSESQPFASEAANSTQINLFPAQDNRQAPNDGDSAPDSLNYYGDNDN